jgi:hypothetical protein
MARAIHIPKTHLIMALCLPLAVILGYFLAEPLDSGSMAVVVFVMTILAVPIMMKWYHPLLIFSWNCGLTMFLLPGAPALWMCMGLAGLLFALLNRSVSPEHHFTLVRELTTPILVLLGAVLLTSIVTGGFGIRSLGATRYGGKAYFLIFTAVAGYFALTSRRIPAERAGLYLAMFFLPGMFAFIPTICNRIGLDLGWVGAFLTGGVSSAQTLADKDFGPAIQRMGGLSYTSTALYCFLFVRYGLRNILTLKHPFRLFLFLLSALGCAASGYRSVLILFLMIFAVLFFLEGLHKTQLLLTVGGICVLSAAVLVVCSSKLPWSIQRTLSFLPVKVDYVVANDAEGSTTWRLQMWKEVLPEIPKHPIVGKGFSLDADELWWIGTTKHFRSQFDSTGAIAANDFHSGPLSVIIPFGIVGSIAFLWFLGAAIRYLYANFRNGDPALKTVNTVLLAVFIGHVLCFFLIFGSLYSDLCLFTGLVGLSVSLNGKREVQPEAEAEGDPVFNPFSSIADGKSSA